jgi:hypothetical protein
MPRHLVSRPRPGRWLAAGALLTGLFAATLIADGTLAPLHHAELDEWDLDVQPLVDATDGAGMSDPADPAGAAFGGLLLFDPVGAEFGTDDASGGLAQGVGHDTFEVAGFVYRGAGVAAGRVIHTDDAPRDAAPSSQAPGAAGMPAVWPQQLQPDTRERFNFPEFASLSGPPALARWNDPAWGTDPSLPVSDTTGRQFHPPHARILADLGATDDDAHALSTLVDQPPGAAEPGTAGAGAPVPLDLPAILLAGLMPGAGGPGVLGPSPLGQPPADPADAPAMPEPTSWLLVSTALGLCGLLRRCVGLRTDRARRAGYGAYRGFAFARPSSG